MKQPSVWESNPRPDTVKAWAAWRVCGLAFLGGSGHWILFGIVVAWVLLDYGVWFSRRHENPRASQQQ